MEIAFNAIGLKISSENTFSDIAANADKNGEPSVLLRKCGKLHGHCWKLGAGLEVWSVLYESATGEILRNDCRPAFRARYAQKINPWLLSESAEQGEAVIHGFIENTDAEVLLELQNLTEIGAEMFRENVLQVGLCGLAYRAKVFRAEQIPFWQSYDEITLNVIANERDWSLCGRVIAFDIVRNPFSGNALYWIFLDLGEFNLEILVNQNDLSGTKLRVGAFVKADVWLQGHIVKQTKRPTYEGVDRKFRTVDFWKSFKRVN
ncbi:MAG: hypothetical protein ACR2F2_02940 [Pyrinomonadaceae bacterium]